jgi:two-component system, sensor histidine kinase and response regulator
VRSEPGMGSTFTLNARVRRVDVETKPPAQWPGVRALVVNENVTAGEVLKHWLQSWQIEVDIVRDGGAATDVLLQATGSRKYQLVLIDGNAPGSLRDTRERPTLVDPGALRVLHLSSAPAEAKVRKPLIKQELELAIARLLEPVRDTQAAITRAVVDFATPALRVLVGEDNEFNAMLIGELLRRRGHQPRVVNDGNGVLSELEARDYDLLLLDLHMPGLDGFQVIREIRAREQVKGGHLSVIALTARSREQDRERCMAAGMDGFVPKPINSAALWAAVAATRST